MTYALIKVGRPDKYVMRTRVLLRPIVFLRVRYSNCVRCNILILLINLFVIAYPTVSWPTPCQHLGTTIAR